MENSLLPIPAKRYFTISEVSNLCGVKPHVLRYWEQEFTQLRPMKRRGNRRYYQHHEVLMIRKIRHLLYEQGFTIIGARNKLQEFLRTDSDKLIEESLTSEEFHQKLNPKEQSNSFVSHDLDSSKVFRDAPPENNEKPLCGPHQVLLDFVRHELIGIRDLLNRPV